MDELENDPIESPEPDEVPVTEITTPEVSDEAAKPQKSASLWKPLGEEFFLDKEFSQLAVDLGENGQGPVMFDIQPETQDGVAGHRLIASVLI